MTEVDELVRNAVDVLPAGALEEKLKQGRPLRVKLGIDPTGPDIHIGFAVVLRRLAAFQHAGHTAVLIVGDYTARIGDPSGRSKERQVLPDEVLDRNAKLFAEQAFRILDRERTEIRFNGEWLGKLDYAELVRLTRTGTVAQLLERDDFAKRSAAREPISVSELLYPFAQGYDSVAVEADIEVGGTDQLYNLLMGREVMQHYGLAPQAIITYELLVGTDGVDKMSKSQGNYVGIDEAPEEQFGKVMSIPDAALDQWWRLALDEQPPAGEPMEAKLALARGIVSLYHGEEAAARAEEHFTRVVREGQAPDDVPETTLPPGDPVHLPAALASAFGLSTSEGRRLLAGGGVKVDGEVVKELDVPRATLLEATVQAGKRRFTRFREPPAQLDRHSPGATIPRPPDRVGATKSLTLDQLERLRAESDTICTEPLEASGASRRLFCAGRQTALVFENSTACVYVETSSSRRLRLAGACDSDEALTSSPALSFNGSGGRHFELKLEGESLLLRQQPFFTESLILAQDERWRRA